MVHKKHEARVGFRFDRLMIWKPEKRWLLDRLVLRIDLSDSLYTRMRYFSTTGKWYLQRWRGVVPARRAEVAGPACRNRQWLRPAPNVMYDLATVALWLQKSHVPRSD